MCGKAAFWSALRTRERPGVAKVPTRQVFGAYRLDIACDRPMTRTWEWLWGGMRSERPEAYEKDVKRVLKAAVGRNPDSP